MRTRKTNRGKFLTIVAMVAVLLLPPAILAGCSQPQGGDAEGVVPAPATESLAEGQADAESPEAGTEASEGGEPGDEGENAQPAGDPRRVTIAMIGDVLMHDQVVQSGQQEDGSYDYAFLFEHVMPLVSDADLRILNQETVMGLPEDGYSLAWRNGNPTMNTPTALADSEAAKGFNVILKATNHTYDQGYDGLAHELDHWDEAYPQIPVLGVDNPERPNLSQDYVDGVYVFEKDGFRVAVLNHTWGTNQGVDGDTDHEYVSIMTEEKVRRDMGRARALGADAIVACPHWGIEYQTEPSDEEMEFSKLYADLGVDAVIGCHPHILQRVETLRNAEGHETVCFYSLGNYVASAMPDDSLIGGVARLTLEKAPDGTVSVAEASLVPTVAHKSWGSSMTTFPVAQYSDELAASSEAPSLTRGHADAFCASVLGEGYDEQASTYVHDVHGKVREV